MLLTSPRRLRTLDDLLRFILGRLFEAVNPVFFGLGSSSHLQLPFSAQEEQAFQHAREWLKDQIYDLSPSTARPPNQFLSSFLEAAVLAFDIDENNAADYIRRAPCCNIRLPPIFIRDEGRYVVHDLLMFLQGDLHSVYHGVSFMRCVLSPISLPTRLIAFFSRHVVERKVPIDVNAFLHLAERVCGSFALAWKGRNGSYHDLTLPRSWLARLLKPGRRIRCSRNILRDLSSTLTTLLQDLSREPDESQGALIRPSIPIPALIFSTRHRLSAFSTQTTRTL